MLKRRRATSITLADLRRRVRVDQADVAAQLGRTPAAIYKAERSTDPLLSTLTAYVSALGRVCGQQSSVETLVTLGKETWVLDFPPRANRDAPTSRHLFNETRQGNGRTEAMKFEKQPRQSPDERARSIVVALDEDIVRLARTSVADLITRTRAADRRGIIVDHLETLGAFFTAFAREGGRIADGGVYFGGRQSEPGLWHALQELHRLDADETSQWNELRRAVVAKLETDRRWERVGTSPRASEFFIPDAT